MTDNLRRTHPEDPTKININERWEVEYWTKKWSVTEVQLRAAHQAVGPSTRAIAARLGKTWP
jgi:hypothetical protein